MKSMYYYLGVEGEEVGALPQADRAVGPSDPSPVPGLGHSASIPSADLQKALAVIHRIVAATHSHIDGRDLLAEIHPRKRLDVKRRLDGRETWHEADWLTTLKSAVDDAKAFMWSRDFRQDRFVSVMRRQGCESDTHRMAETEGLGAKRGGVND